MVVNYFIINLHYFRGAFNLHLPKGTKSMRTIRNDYESSQGYILINHCNNNSSEK